MPTQAIGHVAGAHAAHRRHGQLMEMNDISDTVRTPGTLLADGVAALVDNLPVVEAAALGLRAHGIRKHHAADLVRQLASRLLIVAEGLKVDGTDSRTG